jgi:mycoredoxin
VTDLTVYTTTWCGYCTRLKNQLGRSGVSYDEVNIEDHPGAADMVETINGGSQTVPTVVFHDGTAMTNPSLTQVTQKLSKV